MLGSILKLGKYEAAALLPTLLPTDGLYSMLKAVLHHHSTLQILSPQSKPFQFHGDGIWFVDDGDQTAVEFGVTGGPSTYHQPSLKQALDAVGQVIINTGPLDALVGCAAAFGAVTLDNCMVIDTTPEFAPAWIEVTKLAGHRTHPYHRA